jgi:hypothetical protein
MAAINFIPPSPPRGWTFKVHVPPLSGAVRAQHLFFSVMRPYSQKTGRKIACKARFRPHYTIYPSSFATTYRGPARMANG